MWSACPWQGSRGKAFCRWRPLGRNLKAVPWARSQSALCCALQTGFELMFFAMYELQEAFGCALWCVWCGLGPFQGCLRFWSLVPVSNAELGVWNPTVQGAGVSVWEPLRLSEPQLDSGELCLFPHPNPHWRFQGSPGVSFWVGIHSRSSPLVWCYRH